MIMLGLRTLEGVDLEQYKTRFNTGFQKEFRKIIKAIEDQSLGFMGDTRFALNLEGKTCLNDIVETFAGQIFR